MKYNNISRYLLPAPILRALKAECKQILGSVCVEIRNKPKCTCLKIEDVLGMDRSSNQYPLAPFFIFQQSLGMMPRGKRKKWYRRVGGVGGGAHILIEALHMADSQHTRS
jgi:hypothetical protein